MKRLIVSGLVAAALAVSMGGTAFADSTGTTGQPGQSCGSQPSSPGSAQFASGSAFNQPTSTSPGGTAGQVYAGNGPHTSGTFPGNANPVSQYDVACFQVSQPHP